jgi:hypothetical protein
MPRSTTSRRQPAALPHASEPIRSSLDAIAVLSMAIHRPLEPETIAFFLDESNRSSTITIVSGTTEPDSILSVAECLAAAGSEAPHLCALVLATIRPSCLTIPGDLDRWLEAAAIVESQGLELIEWFVIGAAGIECPRELSGEQERW